MSSKSEGSMGASRTLRACVIVMAALLASCGGAQSRFESHMKRGQGYFDHGDFDKASIEFRNAMQIEPKDLPARLMAATVTERLGHPREALGLFQSVLDTAPQNDIARRNVARLYLFGGLTDQAQKLIQAGLAKQPNDPDMLSLSAAAKVRLNDLTGATVDADRALAIAPGKVDAIEVRAGIYRQRGDLPGAVTLVSGAVAKSPSDPTLREILADLYLRSGEQDEGEQQLAALIKLLPLETRYRYQLAILYSRAKRLDDAQRTLQDAVNAVPKSNEPKFALVDFMSKQRSPAQGEQVMRAFVAKDPDNLELRLGLGDQLLGAKQLKTAAVVFNEIVAQKSDSPSALVARNRLADIALSEGRTADARRLVNAVLELSPRDNTALLRRAQMEFAGKDPAATIEDLRAILRDQPQATSLRKMLAEAYLANGQPGLAEESLRAALDLAPNDVATQIQLARLLTGSNKGEDAIALLEGAVRREPTQAPIRAALVRAYLAKRDFAAARTAAKDLTTLQPNSATGPYMAGLAAEGLNELDEAQKAFQEALRIEPNAIDPLSALAQLEVARGQTAQAIAVVQESARKNPSDAAPLNLLGEMYLQQKNAQAAIEPLTRAISLAPQWWPPYRNRGLAKLATNDLSGGFSDYRAAIQAAPAQSSVVGELALAYETHGRVDDAIALYESLYKRNPRAQETANQLAMLLATYKSDRQSLDRARDLTSGFETSDKGPLLDTNGWVHFKRAEFPQALAVLQRAADKAPDAGQIRYHLGMTELRMGQTARARRDLEAALAGSASFVGADEARSALASLKQQAG